MDGTEVARGSSGLTDAPPDGGDQESCFVSGEDERGLLMEDDRPRRDCGGQTPPAEPDERTHCLDPTEFAASPSWRPRTGNREGKDSEEEGQTDEAAVVASTAISLDPRAAFSSGESRTPNLSTSDSAIKSSSTSPQEEDVSPPSAQQLSRRRFAVGSVALSSGCDPPQQQAPELLRTPIQIKDYAHGQHVNLSHCPVYPKPGELGGEYSACGSLASSSPQPLRRLASDPRHPISLEEYFFPEKIHLDKVPECSAVASRSQILASRSALDQSPRSFLAGDSRDQGHGSSHNHPEASEKNRAVYGLTRADGMSGIAAGAGWPSDSVDCSACHPTGVLQTQEPPGWAQNEKAEEKTHTHKEYLDTGYGHASFRQENAIATVGPSRPDPLPPNSLLPGSSPNYGTLQRQQPTQGFTATAALDVLKRSEKKEEGSHEHSREFQAGTDLLQRRNSVSVEIVGPGFDTHSKESSPRSDRRDSRAGLSSQIHNCATTEKARAVRPTHQTSPSARHDSVAVSLHCKGHSRAESGDSFAQQPPQRLHLRDRLHLPTLLVCRSPVAQRANSRSSLLPVSPWRVLAVPSRVTKIRVAGAVASGGTDRPARYRRRGRGSHVRKSSLRRSSSGGQSVRWQGRRQDELSCANKAERVTCERGASVSPAQRRRSRYRRPGSSPGLSAGSKDCYSSDASPAPSRGDRKAHQGASRGTAYVRGHGETTRPRSGGVSVVATPTASCPRCSFQLVDSSGEERKPSGGSANDMKANEFSKEALEKVPQRDLVSVPSPFPPLPPGQSSFSAERLPTAAQDSFGQSHGHCWFCRVDTRDEKNPPYGSSADILFKKYVRQVERLERKQEALITDTQPEVERLQLMVTKSTRLVYFLIIVNIAVLLLCFFFALFPIHLTGVPAESPENAAIADTPPIDDLPVRAYPMTPPSSPQPFLSSVSPRHATKKTEQQASSMSSAHRGLTERSSTQPKQPLGKPGYPLGYRSSEKRQQTSASQGQPRYLEAQHLAPAPASAPTVFAPLPQLWRLPVEAFKDLAIILKIKADSSKQQAASTKLLTSAAAEEEAYPHKLQTGETKFKKKITFHTGETLELTSGSAILYGANSTLIQQWDFENEDTDPFVGMVNADGGRTLEKHYRDSSEELEREYRDDVFTQRSVESGTRQQLDSGAVSEQFASFSPTSAGPRGAASSLVNGSSSEAVERVTADNVPDAELTGESARGDGTAVHGARALVTSARQYQQPMKLSRREGKTALAGLEAGSNDPSSLSVRDKPIATADAEEETKTKTKASEAGPPPEIPNKQEATVATATDWEVRTSTPTRGRRLMAAAVMGLANAFDQFARLGGALLSPAVSMAQTLDVAGALLANPQSASAALGGTGLPPYMSPTGFGISGAGAVPYGAYGAPVQGPVTAGIVANSPRAPMAVNTGIPVSSLGPATVAVAPQQLYTSSSTLSAPQQVYYYTGGAPGSAYLTASTQLDPTLLTYSPLLGGGLGGGPYNAVTVSTNSDGPLYVIARGQENDPTQGLTDAGQSPAHGAVSLSTSLGAPLRRLEGLPSIRGTRGLDSSEGVTSREVQAASPAPMIRRSGLGKLKAPVDARANENAVRSSSEPATFSKPELASCQRDSGQKMSGEGCRSLLGISHDESMPTSNANFARQHAGVIHQGTAAYVASDARGPPGNKVAGTSTICHPD